MIPTYSNNNVHIAVLCRILIKLYLNTLVDLQCIYKYRVNVFKYNI